MSSEEFRDRKVRSIASLRLVESALSFGIPKPFVSCHLEFAHLVVGVLTFHDCNATTKIPRDSRPPSVYLDLPPINFRRFINLYKQQKTAKRQTFGMEECSPVRVDPQGLLGWSSGQIGISWTLGVEHLAQKQQRVQILQISRFSTPVQHAGSDARIDGFNQVSWCAPNFQCQTIRARCTVSCVTPTTFYIQSTSTQDVESHWFLMFVDRDD